MKVYVLLTGAYDQYGLESVHQTLAGAKAALPGAEWIHDRKRPTVCWAQDDNGFEYAEIWEKNVVGQTTGNSTPAGLKRT